MSWSRRSHKLHQLGHYRVVSRELSLDRAGGSRFMGGMTARRFNASWPLAELVLTDDVIHVQVRSVLLRRLFARVWRTSLVIPIGQLQRATLVRSPIQGPGSFGLRFDSTAGEWVVFWAVRRTIDELVGVLRDRGVSIVSHSRG